MSAPGRIARRVRVAWATSYRTTNPHRSGLVVVFVPAGADPMDVLAAAGVDRDAYRFNGRSAWRSPQDRYLIETPNGERRPVLYGPAAELVERQNPEARRVAA